SRLVTVTTRGASRPHGAGSAVPACRQAPDSRWNTTNVVPGARRSRQGLEGRLRLKPPDPCRLSPPRTAFHRRLCDLLEQLSVKEWALHGRSGVSPPSALWGPISSPLPRVFASGTAVSQQCRGRRGVVKPPLGMPAACC